MRFYNLSQCATQTGRKIYLRSTDIEQRHWRRLLWSMPDEALMELALGGMVEIVDMSTKQCGKIERICIPVLLDVLRQLWFREPPVSPMYRAHFHKAMREIEADTLLRSKYEYWKRLVPYQIDLRAVTIQVEREPNLLED